MPTDPQVLQEKALLLVTRERELNTLRNKHQRLLSWLALSQSLPEIVNPRFTLAEIGSKFVARILSAIKLQKVHLLEIHPDGLRPFATDTVKFPAISPDAVACLRQRRSALVNEPEGLCERAMAAALRLHRFLSYRLEACPGKTVVLVGGFDQERAQSYMPFDQEDLEHFAHAGQHFESLLSNVLLLNELEADQVRLRQFNEELEQRVAERTTELAEAHRETTSALSALREKDLRLSEDLRQARAFQQGTLPELPRSRQVEFGARYEPLDLVGGDIYDVAEVMPSRYRVFVADATGHGVQASLRTIFIKAEYDRLKAQHASPDLVLRDLNERIVSRFADNEMLCTACCFDIYFTGQKAALAYSSAAHPPLVLRQACGATQELYQRGPFLGLANEISPRLLERPLLPGEVVVAYSDGANEQRGAGGQVFGLARAIERHLRGDSSLSDGLQALEKEFVEFRGSRARDDDVTLVAARISLAGA